jgi:hypothetical protein
VGWASPEILTVGCAESSRIFDAATARIFDCGREVAGRMRQSLAVGHGMAGVRSHSCGRSESSRRFSRREQSVVHGAFSLSVHGSHFLAVTPPCPKLKAVASA